MAVKQGIWRDRKQVPLLPWLLYLSNDINGLTTWNFQPPVCSIWEAAALAFSVGEFHPLPPSTLHYTHSPTIPSQHWRETGGALQKARQAHQSKVSLWLDFIKTLQNQTFTGSSLASPSIASVTCKISLAGQTLTWCCQPSTLARGSQSGEFCVYLECMQVDIAIV